MSDEEIDALADQLAGMSLQDQVNDLHLDTNCYYCCVAGALDMTVSELVAHTETMQVLGGEDLDGIGNLIHDAGLGSGSRDEYTAQNFDTAPTPGILCFLRTDGSGHAIRLTGTATGGFNYMDHQDGSSGTITPQNLGPLANAARIWVFPTSH